MKLTQLFSATLMSASVGTALAAADLQITEMWPGNDPGENLTEDWFEIVNMGDSAWVSGVDDPLYYDDESRDPTTADLIEGITSIAPGEAVVVLVTDEGQAAIDEFTNLWAQVYDLDGVQIGTVDGAGLGQGGDGVSLFVGGPTADTEVDFEEFPDANANGGQSYDVTLMAFSVEVATVIVNDEGQPAYATPGNQGAVEMLGDIPEITILGENPYFAEIGEDYMDAGATAFDTEDGDLTDNIVVSGDSVDTTEFAEYSIQYDVTDSDGNTAAPAVRDVIVTHPETIPLSPVPLKPNLFRHIATLGDLAGSEIPAYDRTTQRAYVTSGDGLQIVDLSDIHNPQLVGLIDPEIQEIGLASSAVTSVDACDGMVAFSVPNQPQTDNGHVVILDSAGDLVNVVTVGALPDMLAFSDDCEMILTANEGEPDEGIDPEGSISIIDTVSGEVQQVGFTQFNGQEATLMAAGVRLFPGVEVANDLEPEYVAITKNKKLAYVTLQEANALAVVDIRNAEVTDILPLGLKDHSLPGNELDASDRDSVINIQNWPLHGMYMPDAIATFRVRGQSYFITANEGDARNADARVSSLDLDPVVFPNAEELQNEFNMGRIQVSEIDGDVDGDGDYDVLQSYGARSFSIWDEAGQQVYDSGSDIEAIVATYGIENADDGRSDNKGPEPEGVEVGRIGSHRLAFIGLERTSQVLVYEVTDPYSPVFLQLLQNEGDEAPEGLKFLKQGESPNQCPTLLVTNEGSNTLSIYQLLPCSGE